jgi:short-subunit dehydrogenase
MPQNWLITGTSSGFGRILTELALERGDNVVATVRKPSALDDLKERYGSHAARTGLQCSAIMRARPQCIPFSGSLRHRLS